MNKPNGKCVKDSVYCRFTDVNVSDGSQCRACDGYSGFTAPAQPPCDEAKHLPRVTLSDFWTQIRVDGACNIIHIDFPIHWSAEDMESFADLLSLAFTTEAERDTLKSRVAALEVSQKELVDALEVVVRRSSDLSSGRMVKHDKMCQVTLWGRNLLTIEAALAAARKLAE